MASDSFDGGPGRPPGGKLAEEFAPATFAERGIAVPFTTPLLSQARLRLDRNDAFEFLLPNFTGGKGVYVMPWKSLPSLVTVTLHDRLLFEKISALTTHAPEQIRTAALQVQATGICGPEGATAAAKALEEDQHYLVLTQFILVTELLKLVGIGAADLLRPGMTADQSKRTARQALAKVAQMVDIAPDDLTTRVETLGAEVAPIGLPQCPQPGRLRRLAGELDAFARSAEDWGSTDPSEVSALGHYVATVAKHTLHLARQRIAQVDKACADAKQIIHDEPRLRGAITEQVARTSWLLDGWDFLISLWDSVAGMPPETRQATMVEISRLVPVLPREEVRSAEVLDMEALAKVQRRWVRVNEDWRTGALDMDSVMRVESIKTAMA